MECNFIFYCLFKLNGSLLQNVEPYKKKTLNIKFNVYRKADLRMVFGKAVLNQQLLRYATHLKSDRTF